MTISANVTAAAITPSASSWRPDATLSGAGVAAAVTSTALPVPTVPGAPVGLAGVDNFNIQWQAPSNNGGLPVTGYRVYVNGVDRTNDQESFAEFLTATSWRWGGGGQQTFEVSAVNAIGEGPKTAPLVYSFA